MILNRYTMSRLVISLVTGIIIGRYLKDNIQLPLVLVLASFPVTTVAAFWFRHVFGYHKRWVPGLMISLTFLGLGWIMVSQAITCQGKYHYSSHLEGQSIPTASVLRILEKPVIRSDRIHVFAEVVALTNEAQVLSTEGKIRLTLHLTDSSTAEIYPGTYWLAPSRFIVPFKPAQQWGFNYREWLMLKGVNHVMFVGDNELKMIGSDRFSIRRWGMKQQARMTRHIKEMGLDTSDVGMASAMLYGEKSSLRADDSEAFRKAGVMHVLCVSGLHAGAVYAGAYFLVARVFRNRRFKRLTAILALIPVIAFACITGLAPSVGRATLMLGLHAAGRLAKRKTEGINILSGAAFLMLWNNPPILFDLGFQFSFIAVASIMLLANPLTASLGFRGKGIRPAVGGLALVSLAAQAGTAPLSLFHFHTFPLYFLPANLLVVPASTLVIYTGMISVLLQMGGVCPKQLHWLFHQMVDGMGALVKFWGDLPGAAIIDIPFYAKDIVLIYLILFAAIGLLYGLSRRSLWVGMSLIFLWSILGLQTKWIRTQDKGFIVLSADPAQVVAWQGKASWVFHPASNNDVLNPDVVSFLHAKGLRRTQMKDLQVLDSLSVEGFTYQKYHGVSCFILPENKVLIIPEPEKRVPVPKSAEVEVFIILQHLGQLKRPFNETNGQRITFILGRSPRYPVNVSPGQENIRFYEIKKEGCLRF